MFLSRLLRRQIGEQRVADRNSPGSSQGYSELYQPLDPFNSAFAPEGGQKRKRTRWTEGRLFNFYVGCILFTNSIFLCFEADLGLLGVSSPRLDGLEQDLGLLGVPAPGPRTLRKELEEGLEADKALKLGLEQRLNATVHREVDLEKGIPSNKPAAYTALEYAFVLLYVLEFCLRLCDLGVLGYWRDPWCGLDVLTLAAGVLDLALPFFLPTQPSNEVLNFLALLRLLRVLRIIRMLRVCQELRIVSRAFASAFNALIWTGTLVLILDLACAVVLTSVIGQKAALWDGHADDITAWFGSIGRSLQTLATVATLSGWDEIAQTLEEVIPRGVVVPAFVVYITLCTFTTACLVAGMVGDSFMAARMAGEAHRAREIQGNRSTFALALSNMLSCCDQVKKGYLSSEEFKSALESQPALLSKLRLLDIETEVEELLTLFDRLALDSPVEGAVRIEVLAEAMTHLGAVAEAADIFDLRCSLQAYRRDAADRARKSQEDAQAHRSELGDVSSALSNQVSRQEMAGVLEAVAGIQKEVSSITQRLQQLEVREEGMRCESAMALSTISAKLESLASQGREQAAATEKSTSLNFELAGEALATRLSAELSQRLSSEMTGQLEAACAAAVEAKLATRPSPDRSAYAPLAGSDEASIDGAFSSRVMEPADLSIITCLPTVSVCGPAEEELAGSVKEELPSAEEKGGEEGKEVGEEDPPASSPNNAAEGASVSTNCDPQLPASTPREPDPEETTTEPGTERGPGTGELPTEPDSAKEAGTNEEGKESAASGQTEQAPDGAAAKEEKAEDAPKADSRSEPDDSVETALDEVVMRGHRSFA